MVGTLQRRSINLDIGHYETLTIATGVIRVTKSGQKRVDTQSAAATDDLDTINGGIDGRIITLRGVSSARDVTVKTGTGNITLVGGDFIMETLNHRITLMYDAIQSVWVEVARSPGVSSEDIADTVGAMVTGNTETGITVTYQDADNTLDFELDADLVTIAGLTATTDNVIQSVGSAWASRTPTQLAATFPSASTTLASVVELATSAETITGTDTVRAVTPAGGAAAYQPLDADLTTIAGLTATTNNFIVSVSSAWASRTPAQVKTTLGYPTVTTDNTIPRYDSTAGAIQTSGFTIDDSNHISSFGGNIVFPATQAAAAGANTLDDYEEGTWTPVFSFATVGTSTWVHTTQTGLYVKIGRTVWLYMEADVTPTIGTGSGNVQIDGAPFSSDQSNQFLYAFGTDADWSSWGAGRTELALRIGTGTQFLIQASGAAVATGTFSAANMTSGNAHTLRAIGTYRTGS